MRCNFFPLFVTIDVFVVVLMMSFLLVRSEFDVMRTLSHVVDAVRLKPVFATTTYGLAGRSQSQVDSAKV